VIVLEKYKDTTIRYLGEAGLVHFKQVEKSHIDGESYLIPFKSSAEINTKYQVITSRISSFFKEKKINLSDYTFDVQPQINVSGEVLLRSLEKRLNKLPLDYMQKIHNYNDRIDRFLKTLNVTVEENRVTTLIEKNLDMHLEEIEKKLSNVEMTAVGLTSPEAIISATRQQLEQDQEFGKKMESIRKITYLTDQLLELQSTVNGVKSVIDNDYNYDDVLKEAAEIYNLAEREKQIIQLQSSFMQTSNLVYFEGWVLTSEIEKVKEIISTATSGLSVVIIEEPEEHDEVPTVPPNNPSMFKAFENLAYAFGYPLHNEINIIPLMAITFTIFFGLMFADVGQGILMAIIGVLLTRYRKKVNISEMGDLKRGFLISGDMLILLGISASFFGLLFGEFFGPSHIIHPISLGSIGPFYFGGYDPTHEPMKMLRLAILFGVIHLSMGLGLNIINNLKAKHRHQVLISSCWLWLLWGGFIMWVNFKGLSQVQSWLTIGQIQLAGLVIAPLLLIMVLTGLHGGAIEGLGFGVEVFAESLSHTLSYARLMALGLIHSAMSSIFLALAGFEHGQLPISGIPVFIVGTAMVMLLEGLVVFIHDLRLHWVEWFSKFYSGEGIIFIAYKFKIKGTR